MKRNEVAVSFDEAIGMYRAEERLANGLCSAFGATPEEAKAKLSFAKSLWSGCRLCREAGLEADHESAPTGEGQRAD
jgi:hypothetical protein